MTIEPLFAIVSCEAMQESHPVSWFEEIRLKRSDTADHYAYRCTGGQVVRARSCTRSVGVQERTFFRWTYSARSWRSGDWDSLVVLPGVSV